MPARFLVRVWSRSSGRGAREALRSSSLQHGGRQALGLLSASREGGGGTGGTWCRAGRGDFRKSPPAAPGGGALDPSWWGLRPASGARRGSCSLWGGRPGASRARGAHDRLAGGRGEAACSLLSARPRPLGLAHRYFQHSALLPTCPSSHESMMLLQPVPSAHRDLTTR